MSASPTGVLLTSLGSPESLEDMREYLLDIRHGRPVSEEFVEEIKARYRAAGGRSPLLDIVRRQAQALQEKLDPPGGTFKVYVGMKHWHPYISCVVKQMTQDGIRKIISLPLTPYESMMSLGAYHEAVRKAALETSPAAEIVCAKSWHDHLGLEANFTRVLEKALQRMRKKNPRKPRVLFTAHSLPEKILKAKDPYPDQLLQTAVRVAQKAGLSRWDFAYQSQGGSREPWLGPRVEEMLDSFERQGVDYVLIAPIGFLTDHMEILYDIDILFKKLAKEKGMELERTDSLNDSPEFIETLQSIVYENAELAAKPLNRQTFAHGSCRPLASVGGRSNDGSIT